MSNYDAPLKNAIRHFWKTRDQQSVSQGSTSGRRDTGARSAVTGGKQMDGFVNLVRDLLIEAGLPDATIHCETRLELPGYFRAEKKWDLIVVADSTLLAAFEFKSQVGPSFGNNFFNNRTEEAIGSATDLWTAFREGAFRTSQPPWLGYLMLLEECSGSTSPVTVREPHFPVFPEFRDASYVRRYELLLTHLVRERLYDSACFLLSDRTSGVKGKFRQPSNELAFDQFASSFLGKSLAFAKLRGA
jgi:hypothetical protein